MRDDRFEWDDAKAASNWRDHGITFDMASQVFDDGHAEELPDPDPDEDRYVTVGLVSGRHLTVVWTERGSRRRIISAWRSTAAERRRYDGIHR